LTLLGQHVQGRVAYEVNSGRRYLVIYGDSTDGDSTYGGSSDGDASVGGGVPQDFAATIPQRHVFVLGDNRERSRDSRHFGSVHGADIVGYVDYVYWPAESWSRFGVAN
jgi:signal peptidase I